jgi:hypothetical protein
MKSNKEMFKKLMSLDENEKNTENFGLVIKKEMTRQGTRNLI